MSHQIIMSNKMHDLLLSCFSVIFGALFHFPLRKSIHVIPFRQIKGKLADSKIFSQIKVQQETRTRGISFLAVETGSSSVCIYRAWWGAELFGWVPALQSSNLQSRPGPPRALAVMIYEPSSPARLPLDRHSASLNTIRAKTLRSTPRDLHTHENLLTSDALTPSAQTVNIMLKEIQTGWEMPRWEEQDGAVCSWWVTKAG